MKKRGFSVVAGPLVGWILAILVFAAFCALAALLYYKGGNAIAYVKSVFSLR